MEEVKGSHRLKEVMKSPLVRFEKKEFAPKALGWHSISRVIVEKVVGEQVEVKLNNLRLKGIWPQLLGEGRVHEDQEGLSLCDIVKNHSFGIYKHLLT
jgi:hypothetical protein